MELLKFINLRPDNKGRVSLGKLAEGVSSFRAQQMQDGSIVLHPYTEVPAREVWLYKNPEALAMVEEGLRQSARGETVRVGGFAQYANEQD